MPISPVDLYEICKKAYPIIKKITLKRVGAILTTLSILFYIEPFRNTVIPSFNEICTEYNSLLFMFGLFVFSIGFLRTSTNVEYNYCNLFSSSKRGNSKRSQIIFKNITSIDVNGREGTIPLEIIINNNFIFKKYIVDTIKRNLNIYLDVKYNSIIIDITSSNKFDTIIDDCNNGDARFILTNDINIKPIKRQLMVILKQDADEYELEANIITEYKIKSLKNKLLLLICKYILFYNKRNFQIRRPYS
ncbi:hypothetical protein CUJ83_00715 [Methanocella sp. CWC-04]|uniref:Uncharacterized protein n=1 Tax=Methanooceanicella nereidis TaxID=2052831 RepID=A0AAP2W4Q8_9EURY|nr:hypothetical protein [Methanocella sp. CWC-04]MCD1293517.1 hypothetical protein [Methanocella sp. CWC-04]